MVSCISVGGHNTESILEGRTKWAVTPPTLRPICCVTLLLGSHECVTSVAWQAQPNITAWMPLAPSHERTLQPPSNIRLEELIDSGVSAVSCLGSLPHVVAFDFRPPLCPGRIYSACGPPVSCPGYFRVRLAV